MNIKILEPEKSKTRLDGIAYGTVVSHNGMFLMVTDGTCCSEVTCVNVQTGIIYEINEGTLIPDEKVLTIETLVLAR